MDSKHKQALQELREWCEKYNVTIAVDFEDSEIVLQVPNKDYSFGSEFCHKYYSLGLEFSHKSSNVYDLQQFKEVNFMEQEDDTEK